MFALNFSLRTLGTPAEVHIRRSRIPRNSSRRAFRVIFRHSKLTIVMASAERVRTNVLVTDSKTSSAELNDFKLGYQRLAVLLFPKALRIYELVVSKTQI